MVCDLLFLPAFHKNRLSESDRHLKGIEGLFSGPDYDGLYYASKKERISSRMVILGINLAIIAYIILLLKSLILQLMANGSKMFWLFHFEF